MSIREVFAHRRKLCADCGKQTDRTEEINTSPVWNLRYVKRFVCLSCTEIFTDCEKCGDPVDMNDMYTIRDEERFYHYECHELEGAE